MVAAPDAGTTPLAQCPQSRTTRARSRAWAPAPRSWSWPSCQRRRGLRTSAPGRFASGAEGNAAPVGFFIGAAIVIEKDTVAVLRETGLEAAWRSDCRNRPPGSCPGSERTYHILRIQADIGATTHCCLTLSVPLGRRCCACGVSGRSLPLVLTLEDIASLPAHSLALRPAHSPSHQL